LPPDRRLGGIAVLEKPDTNPHIHMLLSSGDADEQSALAEFLLEVLDNVPKGRNDPWDERWQKEVWDRILIRGSAGDDLLLCRKYSMLTALAPAGTAMVQLVRDPSDLDEVARYMTKSWFQSQHRLTTSKCDTFVGKSLDWKFLSDFHASVPKDRQARQCRLDRNTGLPLTNSAHSSWKSHGVRIQPYQG